MARLHVGRIVPAIASMAIGGLLSCGVAGAQTNSVALQTPPSAEPAAQSATPASNAPDTKAPDSKAPDTLAIYFDEGSAAIPPRGETVLDHASRLYNAGRPIVMIVTGSTDSVGPAGLNLLLSQQRADAVLHALVSRGIPAARFQVVAKGETDLSVPTPPETAEARNRKVEISWR